MSPPTSCQKPCEICIFLHNKFNCPGPGSIFQFFAFIFHFGLLGLYFLSLWPSGPSFLFILAFWALISFHFGLLGLDFLSFWPSGPSFPFILALWAFISFHFGLLGLHFFSSWPFGPSFPFILAFWAFISFRFGFVVASSWGSVLPQVAKNFVKFAFLHNKFNCPGPGSIFQFFAFWAFVSFNFGHVGLHFLSFWPSGPLFPFILAFWAFISFHFGLVGLHFLLF